MRVLAVTAENLGSVHITHGVVPSSDIYGKHVLHMYTCMQSILVYIESRGVTFESGVRGSCEPPIVGVDILPACSVSITSMQHFQRPKEGVGSPGTRGS